MGQYSIFAGSDDGAMDAELVKGNVITCEDGTVGVLFKIGNRRTSYDYIIRTPEGSEIQIWEQEIVKVDEGESSEERSEEENPYEGLDGYHNSIGGYSCSQCHDQGCRYCTDQLG